MSFDGLRACHELMFTLASSIMHTSQLYYGMMGSPSKENSMPCPTVMCSYGASIYISSLYLWVICISVNLLTAR